MKRKDPDKYIFSPIKNIIMWIFPFLFALVMAKVLFFDDLFEYHKTLVGGFSIILFMIIKYNTQYSLRYVEFHDSFMILNHFKIESEFRHYSIPYESIRKLNAVYIPIIGIYKVQIYADSIPRYITVNSFILRHNEMLCRMYSETIKYNPDAEISKNLIRFAERRAK